MYTITSNAVTLDALCFCILVPSFCLYRCHIHHVLELCLLCQWIPFLGSFDEWAIHFKDATNIGPIWDTSSSSPSIPCCIRRKSTLSPTLFSMVERKQWSCMTMGQLFPICWLHLCHLNKLGPHRGCWSSIWCKRRVWILPALQQLMARNREVKNRRQLT